METRELPPSVIGIIEYLARMARGYDNHLKWNEQAKFKADLMHDRQRWQHVNTGRFRERCLAEGMRAQDVTELAEWLDKAKAGRKLIPDRSYRNFRFPEPAEAPPIPREETPAQATNIRDW